jgi:biopolymer transport protein ExbB
LLSIIQAAGWPIWPLILCSILALALIIERLVQLQPSRIMPLKTLEKALESTRHGFPTEESMAELAQMGALGPVLASGLRTLQTHPEATDEDVKSSMEMAGRMAGRQLERYLTTLATIASAAPLLGLLGTVVGMIEIFGAHSSANNQPAQLAHGISVALYNTAFGLIVAIPALMFWRYFRSVVDNHLLSMEMASEQFCRHLNHLRD